MTAMNPRPTPSRQARPRAALVSRDPATASRQAEVLRAAGYDVETCGGPQHEPCPVLGGLPCPMVDRADVLIYDAWVAGSADAGRPQHLGLAAGGGRVPADQGSPGPRLSR